MKALGCAIEQLHEEGREIEGKAAWFKEYGKDKQRWIDKYHKKKPMKDKVEEEAADINHD